MTAGADGVANFEIEDDFFMIYGENSVISRSFAVHADVDDLGYGSHEILPRTVKLFYKDLGEYLKYHEPQVE